VSGARRAERRRFPEIDAVIGTGEVPEIVTRAGGLGSVLQASAVSVLRANGEPIGTEREAGARRGRRPGGTGSPRPKPEGTQAPDVHLRSDDATFARDLPGTTRTARSPRGCDYKCAFCIIPQLARSLSQSIARSIVREVESLRGARR
jgi:tRNA A37 methylthiotransferase MiaB